ncbi:MerR family transcriptional regulator [Clostridium folliculivorans]|uniref:MerR family transcriptional regulator n=1 Tax=Clostridium folliculivorans TaxID=2886038 RepID=A0A9W5Y1U1_9CLOT|nr:MerR family transcriptional regulator [Clostridium folliculivorans]GKU25164.1 MerR family transcriptional regulator [Clostridium folliculivorans]GKU31262.1 MerR family transcriptional regulator [Clostridium folliculivorans]
MSKGYNISEIAEMFNITTNKIRFYEKKGLLAPTREYDNQYRRFSEEDIVRLQSVLTYRSIGLSVDSIKNILKNNGKENYLTHFNNQWQLVNDEIHRLNTIRKSLEQVMDKIYEETDDFNVKDNLLEIISESNKLNDIKNQWKDKWNFNNWARSYDKDVKKDIGELKIYKNYDLILQKVYDLVEALGRSDLRILEIGVGTGNLAGKFLNSGYNIIGIDQSREMLSVAKEKHPKLKVRLGEFLKIPYENKSFDVIISTYAFHHLNETEKYIAIEEIMRVLKDNGVIIMGDLMFESKASEEEILKVLPQSLVEEIKDEYYSYIDLLKAAFEKYNKKFEHYRVDKLNYIIVVHEQMDFHRK